MTAETSESRAPICWPGSRLCYTNMYVRQEHHMVALQTPLRKTGMRYLQLRMKKSNSELLKLFFIT